MGFQTSASGNYSTAIGSNVSTNNVVVHWSLETLHQHRFEFSNPEQFPCKVWWWLPVLHKCSSYYQWKLCTCQRQQCMEHRQRCKGWPKILGTGRWRRFFTENSSYATQQLELQKTKSSTLSSLRSHGPDFYAAFGKDKYGTIGNDTTINSTDFDRVNLIAIRALEKRTQKIQQLEKWEYKADERIRRLKRRLQKTRNHFTKQVRKT